METYIMNDYKHAGEKLAEGTGLDEMMRVCNENNWDNSNTVLLVEQPKHIKSVSDSLKNAKWSIHKIKNHWLKPKEV